MITWQHGKKKNGTTQVWRNVISRNDQTGSEQSATIISRMTATPTARALYQITNANRPHPRSSTPDSMTQSELPTASFSPCPSPAPAHAGCPPGNEERAKARRKPLPVAPSYEDLARQSCVVRFSRHDGRVV
ncbi:hypothetical protein CSIM01_02589 [Colletotrichum simmondsii]|uniref:Uncharacterized protein n=1 Tax=Colletotrichum simmondsii TaxID=703756 RepID=A0A135RUH3_9PEZI|nr:hypothetical protein CSIM01_02589 [Colletotrichum simmondsii]